MLSFWQLSSSYALVSGKGQTRECSEFKQAAYFRTLLVLHTSPPSTPITMQNRRQREHEYNGQLSMGGGVVGEGERTRKEYHSMVVRWGRNCDHFHCDPNVITKFLALRVILMFITVIRTDWHWTVSWLVALVQSTTSDFVSMWSLTLHFLNPNFSSKTRLPHTLYTSFETPP